MTLLITWCGFFFIFRIDIDFVDIEYYMRACCCYDLISLDRLRISDLFLLKVWLRDQTLTISFARYEDQILNFNIRYFQILNHTWYCWLEHIVSGNECPSVIFSSHILNRRHYKYLWMIVLSDHHGDID